MSARSGASWRHFSSAFPNATVWANTRDGLGYDMVFMGQAEPLKIDLDEVQQRLERPDYAPVAESLRDIGIPSSRELFATYAGQKSDLGLWTKGAEVNRDADLRLSYLAGWGINSTLEDYLYREMLRFGNRPIICSRDRRIACGICMRKWRANRGPVRQIDGFQHRP